MKKTLFILVTSLFAMSAQAQDNFLSGFVNACEHSDSYRNFQKDLCKPVIGKDDFERCELGKITLPANIASLVKTHKLTDHTEHTLFQVKLKPGLEFAKNKIISLEQWTGHSNGIWGTALVVDTKDIKSVNQKIKQSGLKIKTLKDTDIGDVGMTVDKGDDGYVRLICDMSN